VQRAAAEQILGDLACPLATPALPSRLVCGISGGADSTLALLVCLKAREFKPEITVQAVHCIHGLDADDPIWLAHVKKLCARLEVPLKTPKLNIIYGGGRSPEEISRDERYKALLSELKGGALVLGHQADDQEENLLLALKRGSGPRGLSGMREVTEDQRGVILRPLLSLHKAEIEEIIKALGFDFVYDISNSYLKFERNFMRLKVLPLLRSRFKGIDAAILRSSKLCAFEHDLAQRTVKPVFEQACEGRTLNLSAFDPEDEALALGVLRMFLDKVCELPPELRILEEALRLCRAGADQMGIVAVPGTKYELRRFRNTLYLRMPAALPEPGSYILKAGERARLGDYVYELKAGRDPQICFALDEDHPEVTLCFGLSGSTRLKPLERAHSRELKKLYAEYGVPYFERESVPVVEDGQGRVLALGNIASCDAASEPSQRRWHLEIRCVISAER